MNWLRVRRSEIQERPSVGIGLGVLLGFGLAAILPFSQVVWIGLVLAALVGWALR